jgi:cell wall-associated NlpC family hydrolase
LGSHRQDDGQILPLLLFIVAGLLIGGLLLFQVAHAVTLRAVAQTAADAAALAAVQSLRDDMVGTDLAVWDCSLAGWPQARARAVEDAGRNGANVVEIRRLGCDVLVTVETRDRLGLQAEQVGTEQRAVRASARARVDPGTRPGEGGGGSTVTVPSAPVGQGTRLEALIAEADRIDRLNLPYLWGGGHQSSPAPPNGPFDCSGAVSRVLQAAGYPIPTMVSRQFMAIGQPGVGRVTVWAYDGHVFMTINGRGWGTGSAPNAGAGWLPYNTPYHSRFVARYLPEFEVDSVVDFGALDLGDVWLPSAAGSPPSVALVPLEG